MIYNQFYLSYYTIPVNIYFQHNGGPTYSTHCNIILNEHFAVKWNGSPDLVHWIIAYEVGWRGLWTCVQILNAAILMKECKVVFISTMKCTGLNSGIV